MRLFNNEFSLSLAESASLPPPLQSELTKTVAFRHR